MSQPIDLQAYSRYRSARDRVAAVLHILESHGGTLESEHGHATADLFAEIEAAGVAVGLDERGLTSFLKNMEDQGWITRLTNGKRTYAIQRNPDFALPAFTLPAKQPKPEPEPEPEPTPVEAALNEPSPPEPTNEDSLVMIIRLAGQVLATGTTVVADEYLKERLATTLEENNRLRTKYREATDEVVALKAQVHALRQNVSALEANLTNITTGTPVNDRSFNALRRFMEQPPQPGKAAQ